MFLECATYSSTKRVLTVCIYAPKGFVVQYCTKRDMCAKVFYSVCLTILGERRFSTENDYLPPPHMRQPCKVMFIIIVGVFVSPPHSADCSVQALPVGISYTYRRSSPGSYFHPNFKRLAKFLSTIKQMSKIFWASLVCVWTIKEKPFWTLVEFFPF